jgi:hypothetical protein
MGGINSLGHQQLTVSSAAVGLTMPTASARPRHAIFSVGNTGPVNWRADGTSPTAAIGVYVPALGYMFCLEPEEDYFGFLNTIKFIRIAGADVLVDIEYFS